MAPFDALALLVPRDGRVLDFGCGNASFSIQLALGSADRTVHGVDISSYKVAQGRSAAMAAGVADRVSLEVVSADWLPGEGDYDAVVISDVLYLLDPPTVKLIVESSCRALTPGGRLVVNEVAARPRWKHGVGLVQEFISVRVLRITKGSALNPVPLTAVTWSLARVGWRAEEVPLHRGYPYSHVAVVASRPVEPR